MNDEHQVRELIDRLSKAVRDEDLERIREIHDADMRMFDVPPPLEVRGLDDYMGTWKLFLASSSRPVAFELSDIQVAAGGDVAFATALGHCRSMERSGETDVDFRLTMGFRKRGGAWRIVHEHHSVPAND